MTLLGIDLGGTKLASALFTEDGTILFKEVVPVGSRIGPEVAGLITDHIKAFSAKAESRGLKISSLGISVPGISYSATGRVWAPNIKGWSDYPLFDEIKKVAEEISVVIDSDRACYILGEVWMGNARGCKNAAFIAVGTGIGAGILVDGKVLRGSNDIAGAIGWMALNRPFDDKYNGCGCFEYHASGEGITKITREVLETDKSYNGQLREKDLASINTRDLFAAYENGDPIAGSILGQCVEFWGMAAANIVSIFNPEKVIFGGGVFGPGAALISRIYNEAAKWAQPISIRQASFDVSALRGDAGIYGAAYLALMNLKK